MPECGRNDGNVSEELKILDRNTVKYMVDQMQEQIDSQKELIDNQKEQLVEKEKEIQELKRKLAEQEINDKNRGDRK